MKYWDEPSLFSVATRGSRLALHRLQSQGVRLTLAWLYGRGLPFITGIPIMRYCQITPQIFVGSQFYPAGRRKLEQLGINADVNLRIEFDDAEHDLALEHYCYLPTVDDHGPSLEHFRQGIAFIEQVVESSGKVYIHCRGGIGRAPTMAAAYFISQGYTLDEAIALIKKFRPFIDIKPLQIEQLKRFEEECSKA